MNITVTDAAAVKIKTFIEEGPEPFFRLSVIGGGCAGLSYSASLDNQKEDDLVVQQNGFSILVDKISATYLKNIKIDYLVTGLSSGFKIENEAAKEKCECGSSFKA